MVQPGPLPVVVPLEAPPPELVPPDEELVAVGALEPAELVAAAVVPAEVPTPPEDAAPAVGIGTPLIWRQQPLRETTAAPIRRGPARDARRLDTSPICASGR